MRTCVYICVCAFLPRLSSAMLSACSCVIAGKKVQCTRACRTIQALGAEAEHKSDDPSYSMIAYLATYILYIYIYIYVAQLYSISKMACAEEQSPAMMFFVAIFRGCWCAAGAAEPTPLSCRMAGSI